MEIPALDRSLTVWTSNDKPDAYPALRGELATDVVVIGGGITGLSAAMCLAAQNKQVVLLEAASVGSGTTGSSTGNIYVPVDKYLHSIASGHDEEALKAVVTSRKAAISRIRQWIADLAIDCDAQQVPWHLFVTGRANAAPQKQDLNAVIEREQQAARSAGLPVETVVPDNFPFSEVSGIVTIPGQMQINPRKYVQGLARGCAGQVRIFEQTQVMDIKHGEPCTLITAQGRVEASDVVMATHTPKGIFAAHAEMEARREYVLTAKLRGALPPPGIYWHLLDGQHYSVRPYRSDAGNFLLVLGEPHVVGTESDNGSRLRALLEYMIAYFDVESIEYSWAAQNYSGADGLPYIGRSPLHRNVHIATGFAADGLVYGTLAGMLISDEILGKESPWREMYKPGRFTPKASAKGIAKENFNVAKHLLKDYLFYGGAKALQEVQPGEGKTMKLDGERVAVHRDEAGELHVVSSVCTHMGCIVHWNSGEKSWDCPCHGSRFSVDGRILEGPAMTPLAAPKKQV